ncbi:MAG: SRPBCC family protein [Chlorobia bacterium]|nr:SRPBCC family protein [Fimbriimonadaceae bacterium]
MSTLSKNTMTLTTPSDREIVLTREFDARRELVFEAYTKPEHISRWWGCNDSTTTCEMDFRVGGEYRFVMRSSEGTEHPFKGIYREISAPERLVNTQIYDVEPYSEFEALITTVFEDLGGRTKLTSTILHRSIEERDGHLNSGMKHGAAESLNRLEELLATMA